MGILARLFKQNSANESNISRAQRAVAEVDTPATRCNLHNALMRQRLILPVPRVPGNLQLDALGRLQQDVRMDFLSFQDRNGRKFMAVFTNPEALKQSRSDAPTWIAVDAPSLCRLALNSGQSALQIDPGSHYFVELSREEIKILAETRAGG